MIGRPDTHSVRDVAHDSIAAYCSWRAYYRSVQLRSFIPSQGLRSSHCDSIASGLWYRCEKTRQPAQIGGGGKTYTVGNAPCSLNVARGTKARNISTVIRCTCLTAQRGRPEFSEFRSIRIRLERNTQKSKSADLVFEPETSVDLSRLMSDRDKATFCAVS